MTKDGTAEFVAVDARAAAIFDLIYPVGAVFATTGSAPARGTWEEIAKGRTLQGADDSHAAGTTIEAGLPNITGRLESWNGVFNPAGQKGAFANETTFHSNPMTQEKEGVDVVNFDASRSSSIYGNGDTVQPPAYVVHFYRRTA